MASFRRKALENATYGLSTPGLKRAKLLAAAKYHGIPPEKAIRYFR